MLGVTYEVPPLAAGHGAYLALPLEKQPEAWELGEHCMPMLCCWGARSYNWFQIATVTEGGALK